MKKLAALLCILTLFFVSSALAEGSFTARVGGVNLLTVRYDENAFRLDTDSYLSSNRAAPPSSWRRIAMMICPRTAADWPITCAPNGTAH